LLNIVVLILLFASIIYTITKTAVMIRMIMIVIRNAYQQTSQYQ